MSDQQESTSPEISPNKRNLIREIALTVGAVAGLVCVLIALSAVLFGITPLVFRSGSMSPSIETGALALSKKTPATEVRIGDVVNVKNAAGNGITHRVVDIGASSSGSVELFLQGDANAERDSEPYVVTDVGRVVFSVSNLGYVVTWLSGPIAVFAGGVLVGVLLMVAFRPSGRSKPVVEESNEPEPSGRHSKTTASAVLVVATIAALGVSTSNPPVASAAPLKDTSIATSGSIQTVIPTPTNFRCDNVILSGAQLSWTNNPDLGYELSFTPAPAGVTNPIVFTPAAGATRTWTALQIASLLMIGNRVFTLRATYNGVKSAPTGSRTVNYVTALATSCVTTGPAGAAARLAPQAVAPSTTTPVPPSDEPTTVVPSARPTTTVPPTTPTDAAPTTTSVAPTTTTTVAPTTTTTTTTPPAPVDLVSPQSSPSGSAVAKVVSVDGSPMLQITDSSGGVQYTAPISSSSEYGYGVAWASGDQLWLLGPNQLIRLDSTGSGWARSVVDPSATDEIPAEIAARLN